MDYVKKVATAKKQTPMVFIIAEKVDIDSPFLTLKGENSTIFIGDGDEIRLWLEDHHLSVAYAFWDRRNSKLQLLDYSQMQVRVEPGAIIREGVTIGEQAIILMGAVVNVGAIIGSNTMIDMNAVIGSGAIIGESCHIGAGAVISGMMEPQSPIPVTIKDHVLIGANATILEGVTVHEYAVVAAGSVVLKDVAAHTIVGGVPAKFLKYRSETSNEKVDVVDALRTL